MAGFADAACRDDHERALPVLGSQTVDRHLGDLHVLEVKFSRRSLLPRHHHPNPRLVFVLSGSMSEIYDGGGIACDRDRLSFHPALLPHRNDIGGDDARAIIIEFCGRGAELLSLVNADVDAFSLPLRRARDLAIELGRSLRNDDPSGALMIESLTLDLVARAARLIEQRSDPRPVPSFFIDASAWIDANVASPITLAGLALRFRVTPRQLADAFRVHAQTTFRDYVRERRVVRAAELIRSGELTLAETALASGFCDQSHLTRVFRQVTRQTPMAYRRQSGTTSGETS
jgi:AraC family transcriptional regulator